MKLNTPPKPGFGIAFKNKDKKHEKGPDWEAVIVLDEDYPAGKELKLGFWNRQGPSGMFLSIKIDNFKPGPRKENAEIFRPKEVSAFDEDIPF